ncbi:MAG: hypothetical protein HC771_13885 [Synechococcales cyanobacterium CRU_2_2]|nr:hypothetical protein [Synechococcales cyanobacterium CRU_2_2]
MSPRIFFIGDSFTHGTGDRTSLTWVWRVCTLRLFLWNLGSFPPIQPESNPFHAIAILRCSHTVLEIQMNQTLMQLSQSQTIPSR